MFVLRSRYVAALDQLGDSSRKYIALAGRWNELVGRINALGGEGFLRGVRPAPTFTDEELLVLIKLCHPDKHGGAGGCERYHCQAPGGEAEFQIVSCRFSSRRCPRLEPGRGSGMSATGQTAGVPIQDTGPRRTERLRVPVYHTHGYRQYMGTCRIHTRADCRHLLHWKPGRRLGRVIMREWEESLDAVPVTWRCKTCWSSNGRTFDAPTKETR